MKCSESVLCYFSFFWFKEVIEVNSRLQLVDLMPRRPCPRPEDISPCMCVYDEDDYQMDLDCSNVKNSTLLFEIFNFYPFPFKHFRKLTIYDNPSLYFLLDNVFGDIQFEEIIITRGVLQNVSDYALVNSYSTLRILDLSDNQIKSFPFQEVSNFTLLETLDLSSNNLTSLTPLTSGSLKTLSLNHNFLSRMSADTLVGLSSLEEVHLAHVCLNYLPADTFANLKNLRKIILINNILHNLTQDTFLLTTNFPVQFDLTSSHVNFVEVNAFAGLLPGSYITLFLNSLRTFEEEVWRPLLDKNVEVELGGNDLECGCDVAWVVENKTHFLPLMHDAVCYDGVKFQDLDPDFYIHYC
ncbi:oplophorus-luciferin 2-monooxygenase non-catalytic subunit-like [Homarus americanus]|uniref:Oplophorus-luciferin 2-monooxygenase non-catalytic subunit-like 5 n=1 Tax=Homarus americanus TaxID=6706 RepID=A0A8J5JV90_HOMAM|nr:oplophorus-luciferin 2-monooxygenase non-catalytic subunit-like [Homarus americanus]KAG7161804.1 Oplophorus-luciferin 2-monooxygenase non-catalytic subunit-like 5 [Homarus americanus]